MLKRKKTSKGKQKIQLQKIADKNALFISFSKRKNGVFTKASDLSTLCGTDVAVVVFSPTGRPFSFGSPVLEPILDRFFSGGVFPSLGSQEEQMYRRKSVHERNMEVMELSRQVEAQRAKKAELEAQLNVATEGLEWLKDLDNVSVRQLDKLVESLELLKTRAQNRFTRLVSSAGASASNAGAMAGHAATSAAGGTTAIDTVAAGGVRPMTNPMLPARGGGFAADPGPSSSNKITILDHAGASGSGGMMMGDPRWPGFQAMLTMGLPIADYYMDPRASSSNAFTVAGLPGGSGPAGFGAIDSGWPGIQAILNPILPPNPVRMVNPFEPVGQQPNPPVEPMDFKNINYMYNPF
ncbi:agamous-like MADS-box protein [Musa troglodytarum]|uniref:Agamous-like MADS-box protein n=1 Tax=Musa troglodytarum TaxID=320322 RepID=A0A9E7G5C2_9LILI|nr:agamous-like MADS-box protein [Musa troglodytarum]